MTVRAGRRASHRTIASLWLFVVAVLAAGCGGSEYTYVTNSDDHTYLKIPQSWRPIDQRALDDAVGLDPSVAEDKRGFWLEGYDAAAAPSLANLLGPHSAAPAVFIGVQDIPLQARGQISLDVLRDMFRPVSAAARQQDAANPATSFSGFGLISDLVLTPGDGLRGVHSVYRYRIQGGPYQVFDQTMYVNDDASKIYMFYVRCSTECYQDRQQEIKSVVSSFTVREKP